MKCKICSRDAKSEGLCVFHSRAYQNILGKFNAWRKASEVSWTQYLAEIQKNSLTGEWAKEVADHLIRVEKKNESKS